VDANAQRRRAESLVSVARAARLHGRHARARRVRLSRPGGSGNQQRNLSGWAAVADREGFIMVYPNGSSNAWNVGRCCPPAADQGVDDVAFVRAVIERLKVDACIDEKRIFASGCSNGGGMS